MKIDEIFDFLSAEKRADKKAEKRAEEARQKVRTKETAKREQDKKAVSDAAYAKEQLKAIDAGNKKRAESNNTKNVAKRQLSDK